MKMPAFEDVVPPIAKWPFPAGVKGVAGIAAWPLG